VETRRATEPWDFVEERLRFLAEILRHISEAVIVSDEHDRIVYWNDAAERIYGWSAEEAAGRQARALIHPDLTDAHTDAMVHALDETGHWRGTVRHRRKDGGALDVAADATSFPGPDGARLLVTVSRDVTSRVQAERALRLSERRFRALFENMLEGYAYCRMIFEDGRPEDFVYLEVNRAFGELTGLHDVVGKRVTEVIPGIKESSPLIFEIYGRVARTGNPERFEVSLEALGGMWLSVSVYASTPDCFIAVFTNITEVRRLTAELEERVRRRTAELEAANRELEGFSYSVSHDLRAPLRSIQGFSNILMTEHEGGLDDEGRRLLGIVKAAAERMGELIDDLLALSRVTRRELETAPIDMTSLARAVVDEVAQGEPDRRVAVQVDELLSARGEESLVRQILWNLVANAFKFTRSVERPRVRVTSRGEGDEAVFEVEDNGVGFDPRYQDKLFQVFQRLHTQEEFTGTGIGLALVRRIVDRHGGRVGARGAVGEGAAFWFSLPADGAPAATSRPGP
jgi:PAS domain S-box-containing protein